MKFLVEDLLEEVKSRSFAPISQNTFSDIDLLKIGTSELTLKLTADIFGVRQDFFLYQKKTKVIKNQPLYAMPSNAIGNTVKEIFFLLSGSLKSLVRLDTIDTPQFSAPGTPYGFVFYGDEVQIYPTPSETLGDLVYVYHKRPSGLSLTTSCAKITAINTVGATTTFTVNTDLTTSLFVGDQIDINSSNGPYLSWNQEVPVLSVSATQISVSSALLLNAVNGIDIAINDYICPTGFSNIPQVPAEFHVVLAQMIATRMIHSMGDLQKWQTAKAELGEMRKEAMSLIKTRAENSPKFVKSRGGFVDLFRR